MKIVDNLVLTEIAGQYAIIPVGQSIIDNEKILKINQTGVFIIKCLEKDLSYNELLKLIIDEYQAEDKEVNMIRVDLNIFLENLKKHNLLISGKDD